MTDTLKLPAPTWFVGCGNMGGAILDGWRIAGLDLSPLTVVRPSGKAVEGTRVVSSLADAGQPPRVAVLAFKPQKLAEIARELQRHIDRGSVIMSLLAGVEITTLRGHFRAAHGIVRATPNLSVAIRRGVTGLYGDVPDVHLKQNIGDLFSALGFAMWMADEQKLAALGSLAGAGPAYVARFISALAKAGVKRGLTHETAATIALETVFGTAWMAAITGETMDSVARRVASPKGTTQAGLDVLDRSGALDDLIAATIAAAADRGEELAQEAKAASLAEAPRLS